MLHSLYATHTNKTEQKTINYGGVWRMSWGLSQPEERSYSGVWWYGSGYFCITCQMAAGWTGCGWGGYCLLVSFRLCTGTSPISLMLRRWILMIITDIYLWKQAQKKQLGSPKKKKPKTGDLTYHNVREREATWSCILIYMYEFIFNFMNNHLKKL